MKTSVLLLFLVTGVLSGAMGQITLDLTFTAVNGTAYVQVDSIKIMNRTQGGDTVLYWPDTVLSIYYSGIRESSGSNSEFQVFQNYPNPVIDQSTISLYIPDKDHVSIMVTDIHGRVIVQSERVLDKGKHTFQFMQGNGDLCFFTAIWQGQQRSIKILQSGIQSGRKSALSYLGREHSAQGFKTAQINLAFKYYPGDLMLFIGYANGLESGMLNAPMGSTIYTLQFATNISCPGTPSVTYEGQVYNTIQIFSQCWLKKNLNVGTMIPGNHNVSNNGILEKYCYNDQPDSCSKYGGLYHWNEMMQYTTQQGAQGICPPGWYLPTDEDWKVLEGAADSHYAIGDDIWNSLGFRGTNAGENLKATSGWSVNGNGTDLFSFSGLPAGDRDPGGPFGSVGNFARWHTSTSGSGDGALSRGVAFTSDVIREGFVWGVGLSVRCLRNY